MVASEVGYSLYDGLIWMSQGAEGAPMPQLLLCIPGGTNSPVGVQLQKNSGLYVYTNVPLVQLEHGESYRFQL